MRTFLPAILAAALLPAFAWPENLTINQLLATENNKPAWVVYELPGGEGRDELMRSLEMLRNRFWPKATILDATGLDEATLRDKIKGPFVLYSLLDARSRLLKLTAQPTPYQLDDTGMLHWRDLAVRAKDIRMVFVGRNPYSKAPAVVYAAGTEALLAKANNMFHGPCSFHIYQGDKLLREGYYDQNFTEKSTSLSLSEAMTDVTQYFATVEYVHPNLFTRQTETQYQALKQRTRDGVAAHLDQQGQIRIADLAHLIRTAAVAFEDAHTGVHWSAPVSPGEVQNKRFPPFWLEAENGHFVIAAAKEPELEGKELMAIDGVAAVDFLRPLLDSVSGETLTGKAAMALREQHYWFFANGIFGSAPASLMLKMRDVDGVVKEIPAANLGPAEYEAFLKARASTLMGGAAGKTRVEFLEQGRVAHLIYPRCETTDTERRNIQEIFARIKESNSQELIIDIRGNPGGSTMIVDYLFSFLYAGKFMGASRITSRFIHGVPESIWKGEFPGPPPPPKDTFATEQALPKPQAYRGKVYLLIDNNVFSSAVYMSLLFRDYHAATIIGYETGGVPLSFGNTHTFQLKNSGIECNVSDRRLYPPKPRPGDDQHGVLPDVPLDRKLLAPYAKDRDPALSFTLHFLHGGL